ncbi:MAG: M1 family aminopeptidase [Halioglobus sp.]
MIRQSFDWSLSRTWGLADSMQYRYGGTNTKCEDEVGTLRQWILVAALVLTGAAGMAKAQEIVPGVSLELAEYRAAHLQNINYRLYFDVPADSVASIAAAANITFDLDAIDQPLQLDFRESPNSLKSLSANGIELGIQYQNEHIVLPPSALRIGSNTVQIEFEAGSSSLNRNPEFLYTLFVPDRARTTFPLFDQPNLKATFDLTLDVPVGWKALSNGAVASKAEAAGKTRYRFTRTDPISSYLFSFVAGEFETVSRTYEGGSMTLWHRETDGEKVTRNIDSIFDLHIAALAWMEDYTGITYPFSKFDFVLLPDFPYGGMEHVGAIQYRASSLWLEESATESQILKRASLIAHETAHMWFGNLVTMNWFDDVWTKEVFANLMAGKIISPAFPGTDHQLTFLHKHYPSAYGVDRSQGANPIRQQLPNLNEAGQMYGDIIYHKAPIMMRQLELLLGEEAFRQGLQEYLHTYSLGNARWSDLIKILDLKTGADLIAWSQTWVNTSGRPEFEVAVDDAGKLEIVQLDPQGLDRVWPQQFSIGIARGDDFQIESINSVSSTTPWPDPNSPPATTAQFNFDGMGYGLFPTKLPLPPNWSAMEGIEKSALLINLYENLLSSRGVEPYEYLEALLGIVREEDNELLLDLALSQLSRVYVSFLTPGQQQELQAEVEDSLWLALNNQTEGGKARLYFGAFSSLASSSENVLRVYKLWSKELKIPALSLSETDYTRLAEILAIRFPAQSPAIIAAQLGRIQNPDKRRRLQFIAPSLSADEAKRDAFFASLAEEHNRGTENWVLSGLANLHHPSRRAQSQAYLASTLELLQEIQQTGDIFFPARWLEASLKNHNSAEAVAAVEGFLSDRPDYNKQLRMKILQAADIPVRANNILSRIAKQPMAENINLREVVPEGKQPPLFRGAVIESPVDEVRNSVSAAAVVESAVLLSTESVPGMPNKPRKLLGVEIPPSTTTRLNWTPSHSFSGMAIDTPVLAVNGAFDGPTLCLTAAIHGDEINGIEMIRRVMYNLDPTKLHGMVVGVPIVNLLGFSRNSRYLPDRRDLNRYFPGNPDGSMASRIAYGFFTDVIMQCNAVVDLHTGSFYRTNITQLRVDMSNPQAVEFAALFGDIPVLNTPGNRGSLRAAAVRAGIPTATLEAGEPMRMQVKVVEEGVAAINTLLDKNGMYPSFSLWAKPSPAFYRSSWVRANASGILFSRVELGGDVRSGDVLGEVINPVTNERSEVVSGLNGRILGMALDQFVLPGFAVYHIGIRQPMSVESDASLVDSELANDHMPTDEQDSQEEGALLPMSLEEEGFDD